MKRNSGFGVSMWGLVLSFVFHLPNPASGQSLMGIDWDSSNLYRISPSDGSLSLVGNTGITNAACLEAGADGFLYAVGTGESPMLHRISPADASATTVGPLNVGFVFEGGLALAPDGTAYGMNQANAAAAGLFRIDLASGAATLVGALSGGLHDVNGLAWRSDGMLVGLDRVMNLLIAIDPATASWSAIAPLSVEVGGVGGMTVLGNQAFFSTGGPMPTQGLPGSNALYTVDLFAGAPALVGSLAPTIFQSGLSGLAIEPLPCSTGTVNASAGSPVDVLFVNGSAGGSTRTVTVGVGQSVEATLFSPPAGPIGGRYIAWIWFGAIATPTPLVAAGAIIGCTINPTPISPGRSPQPVLCLRDRRVPPRACSGAVGRIGPFGSSWTLRRSAGVARPMVLSIQAATEDSSAILGASVTNAVTLVIQ